ncbi:Metallo-beta-lactamase superfamily hydrolase [Corynebacterium halotolerans YIM 70093 = DSM 44683]|uniref:Metallo-beta-lactamase superfamily hydrolase n=2 Tax=Corynebacterium halotolerans TaxID=225326 RepID=M1MZB4_9CORY|nr:Metallo-beta-lactamase superfamily hydrolase [Corynebacterium halotolerans YIM 70093 = DSM 44683]
MGSFNTGGNSGDYNTSPFDTSTSSPGEPQRSTGSGCLKWGAIIFAFLAVIGLIGSCTSEPTEVEVPGPTTTVTVTEEAERDTTTVTTTVTEEAEAEPQPSEPTETETDAAGVGAGAGAGAGADVDNRQRMGAVAPPPVSPARAPEPAAPAAPVATSYANCSAVRAAGAAPIYAGQPGYSTKLDRDGDGVACER